MSIHIDRQDYDKIAKLADLTSEFTEAVIGVMGINLPDIMQAMTDAEREEQFKINKEYEKEEADAQRNARHFSEDMPELNAKGALASLRIQNIFARVASRIMDEDDLTAKMLPEIARQENKDLLDKYKLDALSHIVSKMG